MKRINIIFFLLLFSQDNFAQNWGSVQSGIGRAVLKIYSDSSTNKLYAIGVFSDVSGVGIKGIASWNGSHWDSLSAGIDGLDTLNQDPNNTFDITRFQNELYVCGVFNSLGRERIKNIGKWNGLRWDSLSTPPQMHSNSSPTVMNEINSKLYIGGSFDSIGGIPANSLATWDGNIWASLDFPDLFAPSHQYYSEIVSMCIFNSKLYVGGLFFSSPVDTIGNIMCYDGNTWRSVAGGIHGSFGSVSAMIVYHNQLYVGGYFLLADGNAGNYIQRWDGFQWSDVGGGVDGYVNSFEIHDDKLFAFGAFLEAGGVPAEKIAIWDGTNWCGLGSSFDNNVSFGAFYKDTLYVCGGFNKIDNDSMRHISKWIGGNYEDTCSSVGIITYHDNISVNVFPIPAFNFLQINFNQLTNSKIKILNVLGETIVTDNMTSSSYFVNVSSFSPGIYFLEIQSKEGFIVKKFVKE